MSRALRFKTLKIRRMPGFPGGGLSLDPLSPGINLIHGPNASGKTTTARALQALLWNQAAPETAGLEGRLELDGAEWLVDVDGRRTFWQRNGQDASAPPLPPADSRDRYFLSLHGLLVADDHELAERIRVESAGGYDMARSAKELGFGTGGQPRKLLDALKEARSALANARAEENGLRESVRALSRLETRWRDMERQAGRVELLRRAVVLAHARVTVAEAESTLAAFPSGVGRLGGQELAQVGEWEEALEKCERTIEGARIAAQEAGAALEAAGLGADGVPGGLLEDVEAVLERLRRLDDERARVNETLTAARAARMRAAVSLRISEDREPLPDPSAADADRLANLVRGTMKLAESRAALEERLRYLGSDRFEDAPSPDGIRALRQWLRVAEGPGGSGSLGAGRRTRILLTTATVILGLVGVAVLAASVLAGGSTLLLGVGAAALVTAFVLLALRPGPSPDLRTAHEQEAKKYECVPERWSPEAVEELLDSLEKQDAAARLAQEKRSEAKRLEGEREALASRAVDLETERTAIAADLGIDPAPDALALDLLATRLRQWEHAREAESEAAGTLDGLDRDRESLLERAVALLIPFGYRPTDGYALAGVLKNLRERRDQHREAVRELADAHRARDKAESDAVRLRERRATLFAELGLAPDADRTLWEWTDQLEEYRAAADEARLARRSFEAAGKALAAERDPGEESESGGEMELGLDLGTATVATLTPLLEAAERAAEERGKVQQEAIAIQTRLEDARDKHSVEAALAQVAAAEAALADQRDSNVEAEVGTALVTWLQSRASDHNRPAVFHRARELFATITRGRYQLDMRDEGEVEFRAFDTTTHRGHALEELSSGTRLQLLLAVRIAFVETQETGAVLPFLLDEVLANCDDHRARAIIDAAVGLARAGRQIFYFTAQADELMKWRDALEAEQAVCWSEQRLIEGAGDVPEVVWTPSPTAELPDPALGHSAYGHALQVPRFNPWADGMGGLHLWYLLEDVPMLHALLQQGITRWGQLEQFLRTAGDGVPAQVYAAHERGRQAVALCDRFRQLWQQGRGRRVDRLVLRESGAVSDTFLDRVTSLCEELEGRGDALVEALANGGVPRFHAAKTDDLRAYLLENGFMSNNAPLPTDRIRVMLAAEAARCAPNLQPVDLEALVQRLANGPSAPA